MFNDTRWLQLDATSPVNAVEIEKHCDPEDTPEDKTPEDKTISFDENSHTLNMTEQSVD
jgi:hypothetical protein